MVIDFHTHIFPDDIADKAISTLSKKGKITAMSDGTLFGLKASMAEAGIDCSVVLPVATSPKQVESINNFAIKINSEKIASFGGMHPDYMNVRKELQRLKQNGIKGIKIHPDYQGVYLDDLRYVNMIDEAFELGLIVVTHAGFDVGFPEDIKATPDRIVNLLDMLKNKGVLILAHMGGVNASNEILDKVAGRNVYFDTSLLIGGININNQYYELMNEELFKKFVVKHGADKIVFGTDSPWRSQKELLDDFNRFHLSIDEKEKILFTNAQNLLKK